jgi:hypothetical protein
MERPRGQSGVSVLITAAAAIALLNFGSAHAASQADNCEAAKLKIAGQYDFCQLKAQATAVKTGGMPDYSKCNTKFGQKWMAVETAGNGMCPTTGDAASIQTRITTDSGDLAVLLSGGSVSVCGDGVIEAGEQCDFNNLNGKTCQTQGFAGGTLTCGPGCAFDTSGCFATRFVDNGDGTVTDHQTGLQWEQKDNFDSIANSSDPHDADNQYSWSASGTAADGTAYTDFLSRLNSGGSIDGVVSTPITGCFAGHCDWRLPTIVELQTITDFTQGECGGGSGACIDAVFGPTQTYAYWSNTSVFGLEANAWGVDFSSDGVYNYNKVLIPLVFARGVRNAP